MFEIHSKHTFDRGVSEHRTKFELYKRAFLSSSDDLKFANWLINLGKCIGVIRTRKFGLAKKCSFVIILLSFACFAYFTVYFRIEKKNQENNSLVLKITIYLRVMSEFAVISLCIFTPYFMSSKWETFTRQLQTMKPLCNQPIRKYSSYRAEAIFVLGSLVSLLICHNTLLFLREEDWKDCFIFSSFTIAYLYTIYIMMFLRHVFIILNHRYINLKNSVFNLTETEVRANVELEIIMDVINGDYEGFKALVLQVNTILGWHTFFCVEITVVNISDAVMSVVSMYQEQRNYGYDYYSVAVVVSQLVFSIVLLIFSIIVIWSSDAVERSNANILETCYHIRLNVKNPILREKIMLLAIYVEEWKPILSAAGFYDVNRKCIYKIFSSLMTYLIVMLQLNE